MRKIRKGDRVEVIAGEHKGRRGEVLRVLPKEERVIVQGVNLVKVHQRRSRFSDGGIIEREAPLHISNVALICSRCDKGRRVGVVVREDGRKVRQCKKCGEFIE